MASTTRRVFKKVIRALGGVLLTYFVIVLVDLQLRTKNPITTTLAERSVVGPRERQVEDDSLSSKYDFPKDSVKHGDGAQSEISPEKSKVKTNGRSVFRTSLEPQDIFIAVKTTGRFHRTRLDLLLDTWISITKDHVSSFECNHWEHYRFYSTVNSVVMMIVINSLCGTQGLFMHKPLFPPVYSTPVV